MNTSAQAKTTANRVPEARSIQETLGQSFTLPNGQQVKNRLIKSAMSETLGTADNRVQKSIPRLYRRWADGGIGLQVTGNVMIDRRAIGEPGNVCVEDERDLTMLRKWAEAGQANDARIYVQLNHPGRQVPRFLNQESVSPSSVPFREDLRPYLATPRALSESEIEDLIERFGRSATIFDKAGFDGAQIHGAHGYLVSQFLSPLYNQRTDRWGGSPENRRRFALEVYRAIRQHTGSSFSVSIKINSADFQQGGLSEEESTETVVALAAEGVDFVEISGGTYEAPVMVIPKKSTRQREAYFLSFCETLRTRLDAPLVVTGGFRSGAAMAEAIQSGAVDFVGLARTLAVRPDFPNELLTQGEVRCDLERRTTGIPLIDRLGMLELMWYERQLHRIGSGKEPRPHENPLYSLVAHLSKHGINAIRTRRAR